MAVPGTSGEWEVPVRLCPEHEGACRTFACVSRCLTSEHRPLASCAPNGTAFSENRVLADDWAEARAEEYSEQALLELLPHRFHLGPQCA